LSTILLVHKVRLIINSLYAIIALHMLKIRLQRIGRKNDPSFRVVLTDSKNAAKSGKFKEILGSYNVKTGEVLFKADRIKDLLKTGAQTSATVHNYLVHQKIIEGKKKNVLSKKSPTKPRKELKK
jgi:small subunit ribosomal protein S16